MEGAEARAKRNLVITHIVLILMNLHNILLIVLHLFHHLLIQKILLLQMLLHLLH